MTLRYRSESSCGAVDEAVECGGGDSVVAEDVTPTGPAEPLSGAPSGRYRLVDCGGSVTYRLASTPWRRTAVASRCPFVQSGRQPHIPSLRGRRRDRSPGTRPRHALR